MFEKLLQGFKIGDLPYADFQFHLKRLLSTGAPAEDLMAVLRRREAMEPLPEYARDEVQGLLNAAIERAAAQKAESAAAIPQTVTPLHGVDTEEPAAPAEPPMESEQYQAELRTARDSLAARDANIGRLRRLLAEQDDQLATLEARVKVAAQMSAELQAERKRAEDLAVELADSRAALASERSKSQAMDKVLTQQSEMGATARVRGEEAQRQSEQYQAELRAARDALMALQQEHEKSLPVLKSQERKGAQLESELKDSSARADALAANLSAAQAALQAEKAKSHEWEEGKRELERYQTDLRSVRDALAARDQTISQVKHSLGERNAHVSAMQEEHRQTVASLEARAKSTAGELQAARARIDGLAAELKASRDASAALKAQHQRDETQLRSLRAKLGATQTQSNSYLEVLQTHEWRKGFDQNQFRESEAHAVTVEVAETVEEASVAAKPKPTPTPTPMPMPMPKSEAEPVRATAPAPAKVPSGRPAVGKLPRLLLARVMSWPRERVLRTAGACAAVVGVILLGWLILHWASAPVPVPAVSARVPPSPGTVIHDCARCPGVTVLPVGRFIQGSERPGSNSPFEKPLHWVAIGRSVAMSTNPVTVDEFSAFVAASGRDMRGCDTYDGDWKHHLENSWENPAFVQTGSHPVTCVSWNDARAYAGWLSATTGHKYRLPSASEWEYASRSGGDAVQPWNPDGSGACENANVADQTAAGRYPGWMIYDCNDGYIYTAPVGSFKANSFGLHDMLGNVFQWTEDCWFPDYVGAPVDGSARTAADCSEHELRGGSWYTNPAFVRADYRNHFDANYRASSVGIRLVRELTP